MSIQQPTERALYNPYSYSNQYSNSNTYAYTFANCHALPNSPTYWCHNRKLDSGETRVIDYDNGYVLLLDNDWLPIPPDTESLKEVLESASSENPELEATIRDMRAVLQDDTLRLLAFNINNEYRDKTFFSNLMAISLEDKMVEALPLELLVELNVEQIKEAATKATVIESGIGTNKNDVPYGYIALDNQQIQGGKIVSARQHIIIIKKDSAMIMFSLTIPSKVKNKAAEISQKMIDSIYLIEDYQN